MMMWTAISLTEDKVQWTDPVNAIMTFEALKKMEMLSII